MHFKAKLRPQPSEFAFSLNQQPALAEKSRQDDRVYRE